MKKFGVALFALVLWLSLTALGQNTSQQQSPQGTDKSSTADQQAGVQENAQQGSMSQGTTTTGKKAHSKSHLMGKISDDGKSLTDKDGKSWSIDNPDAVKGHEGHEVTL
ncbi:MAG TPA: hypothetical protein VFI95_15340, partial [Terriglobales bacterium]|nr:hypothetical protein [Terriglobales bacterium]